MRLKHKQIWKEKLEILCSMNPNCREQLIWKFKFQPRKEGKGQKHAPNFEHSPLGPIQLSQEKSIFLGALYVVEKRTQN